MGHSSPRRGRQVDTLALDTVRLEENTWMGIWNVKRSVLQTESMGTPTRKDGWQPNKLISSPRSRRKIRRVGGVCEGVRENLMKKILELQGFGS